MIALQIDHIRVTLITEAKHAKRVAKAQLLSQIEFQIVGRYHQQLPSRQCLPWHTATHKTSQLVANLTAYELHVRRTGTGTWGCLLAMLKENTIRPGPPHGGIAPESLQAARDIRLVSVCPISR